MSTQTLPVQDMKSTELISYDPGTGREIGRAPLSTPQDVKEAVAKARQAQAAWARLFYRPRARGSLTARELGRAPLSTPEDVKEAVARARRARPAWASLSYRQRARVILQARKLMLAE